MRGIRKREIDIAKGIGIILVVLCHTLSPVMEEQEMMSSIYKFVYTFHMPLFFFLAGCVSKVRNEEQLEQTKAKFNRLLIPYITWAFIYWPLKNIFSEMARSNAKEPWWSIFLGNNPDGELWFLYVLFVFSLVLIWIVNEENLKQTVIITVLISLFAQYIPHSIRFSGISLFFSLYQIGFYFLGVLVGKNWEGFIRLITKPIAFFSSLIITLAYGVVSFVVPEISRIRLLMCPVAIAAIISVISLSYVLSKKFELKMLDYIGCHSMEIFILHAPILILGRSLLPKLIGKGWIYVFVLSIIAISCSLFIDDILLSKYWWIRAIVAGKKNKVRKEK